jgi:hypothetical protein
MLYCSGALSQEMATSPNEEQQLNTPKPGAVIDPGDCMTDDECICFTGTMADLVTQRLIELEKCRSKVESLEKFNDKVAPVAVPIQPYWWQEPTFVIGGIVVGVSVGVAIGVLISK